MDSVEYLGASGSMLSLNLYAYCENNPIMYVDSNGNYSLSVEIDIAIPEFKNEDGSWSVYDNDRFDDYGPFHEQIFVLNVSCFSDEDDNIGGKVSLDLMTGGWEWKNCNLSLLDIGHAEASFEITEDTISVSLFASIYSPNISFTIFGVTIGISLEIGAIGYDVKIDERDTKLSAKFAAGWGIGFDIDW